MNVDPFAQVLALDEHAERRFLLSLAATLIVYSALAARLLVLSTGLHGFAEDLDRTLRKQRIAEYEVVPPPPPPPEPPPEPTQEPEEVPKEAPPKTALPTAPPAAAEAGKVLTADPDPNEPVDLTDQGFVQGTADAYAGGVTATDGTSKNAVRDMRAAGAGVPGTIAGPAVAPAHPKRDLSQPAKPLSGSWDHCGFPAEADIEQVNYARVSLTVTVTPDGHADSANVTSDPGYGFGALAKRCALRERFSPALDRDGAPFRATQLITINFRR